MSARDGPDPPEGRPCCVLLAPADPRDGWTKGETNVPGTQRQPTIANAAFGLVRAEVAGFEPARGLKPSTRLAGGRHRPD